MGPSAAGLQTRQSNMFTAPQKNRGYVRVAFTDKSIRIRQRLTLQIRSPTSVPSSVLGDLVLVLQ